MQHIPATRPIRRLLLCLLLAACAHVAPAAPAQTPLPARNADDAFLDGLVGNWEMDGRVMGEPVRYHARGARTLAAAWLEFHMIDVNSPPQYEARVFIAADAGAADYVAHWLDQFGGAGARVVGTGSREGDALRLEYPYARGAFRNIWRRQDDGAWSLQIDSQNQEGSWSEFASYTLRRRSQ